MPDLLATKLFAAIIVWCVTLSSGWLPLKRHTKGPIKSSFPIGEALACGVFLGAGLIHLLADSVRGFSVLQVNYPWAFFLAGAMFLLLLFFEHWGREVYEHRGGQSSAFAVLAVLTLSLHSLLLGMALGLASTTTTALIVLLAILAHKWAVGFALGVQLNTTQLNAKKAWGWFLLFSVMTPIGIILGGSLVHHFAHLGFLMPVLLALSAGTLLYLGTLHGLSRAVMIDRCCDFKTFSFVIIGFLLMAVVAVWA